MTLRRWTPATRTPAPTWGPLGTNTVRMLSDIMSSFRTAPRWDPTCAATFRCATPASMGDEEGHGEVAGRHSVKAPSKTHRVRAPGLLTTPRPASPMATLTRLPLSSAPFLPGPSGRLSPPRLAHPLQACPSGAPSTPPLPALYPRAETLLSPSHCLRYAHLPSPCAHHPPGPPPATPHKGYKWIV